MSIYLQLNTRNHDHKIQHTISLAVATFRIRPLAKYEKIAESEAERGTIKWNLIGLVETTINGECVKLPSGKIFTTMAKKKRVGMYRVSQ